MKFEDIQSGMYLVDKHNEVYKVLWVSGDIFCIAFVGDITPTPIRCNSPALETFRFNEISIPDNSGWNWNKISIPAEEILTVED